MTPEDWKIAVIAVVGLACWAVLAWAAIGAAWRDYQEWIGK